jgi:cation transport ATPase
MEAHQRPEAAAQERRHERFDAQERRHDDAQERRHERFGGLNWGAAFFGWLVAVGMAVLLTTLLSAAGAAVALSEINSPGEAASSADTVGIVGGIGIILIGLVSYFAGGYVAGRMSRFDGARQGLGVWLWAIIATVILALLGLVAGEEWNLFAALDLPRLPVDEDATTAGIIVLVLVALGTLLAAMAGGKAGERYHRRVDRAGYEDVRDDGLDRDDDRRTRYVERTV